MTVIQHRRGTAAEWAASSYILEAGEIGFETDTNKFKFGDGTTAWNDLKPYHYGDGTILQTYVKNNTGSTIGKGKAVYISGATGANALISLADADAEATSSKTLGLTMQSMATGDSGYVITNGTLTGVNTSAYTEGTALWLSSTPGDITSTKPTGPVHSVYIGVVTRSHATVGEILVKIQNGYELDELHDVAITSNTAGEILKWNGTTWVNNTLAEANIFSTSPTILTNTEDLNSLTTPGLYHQNANADSSTARNYPVAQAGMLYVMAGEGFIYQQYQTYAASTSNKLYVRGYYNSAWQPWRELVATNISPTFTAGINVQVAGNSWIALGRVDGTASNAFIDFNTGATAVDYDSRIYATGGTGTAGGGTIALTASQVSTSSHLVVGGNLTVGGTTTTVNAQDLVVNDPLIYIGEGNTSNVVDIGVVGSFNNGTYQHSGLVRDASDGIWKLFSNVVPEPTTVVDFTSAIYDVLKVGSLQVTNATTTRSNLGLVIGTDVQAYDADLTAISALAGSSGILKKTAPDTWALITDNSANWDTAYTDRNKWDGGSTGLVAATGRTSLGATTVGGNLFTLTNPSAVTFLRVNADNTVSALDAATFRSAIGAGTSSTTGTVTSVSVVTANGFAGTVTATATPAITLKTTVDGLLKGTSSTGVVSAATAGTDYLAPPSGTALLKANSGGALANAVAGTDYQAAITATGILKGGGAGSVSSAVASDVLTLINASNISTSGTITSTATTASSSTSTGAIVSSGGIGVAGNAYIGGDVVITGNVTVNGTTSTINANTLTVDDKNIEIASVSSGLVSTTGTIGTVSGTGPYTATITNMTGTSVIPGQVITATAGTGNFGAGTMTVASVVSATSITVSSTLTFTAGTVTNITAGGPTNITADGGGITVKGTTDKTLTWVNSTAAWTSSEDFNIISGKVYEINGTSVLSSTTLGSGIVNSSLTKIGALSGGTAGFVKVDASGNLTSDSNTYLTTSTATSTYMPLSGGTFTGTVVMSNFAVDINDADSRVGRILGSGNIMYIQGGADLADTTGKIVVGRTGSTSANISQLDLRSDTTNVTGTLAVTGATTLTGALAANGGITSSDATKPMNVAAGYTTAGGFSGTKVIMTATATGQTAPTLRPGGGALQAGDIWISW